MGLITGPNGAWQKISERIQNIPEYVTLFKASIPNIKSAADIQFTDISNVIATFIASEWKAVDSPFDRFLQGDSNAISKQAQQGLTLFYGKANCSSCHSGTFQTDHKFHAIAVPEFGPGKIARFETVPEDLGRMRVTGKPEDKYKFRTPSLRNISLTSPYGHNGAFANLKSVIKHHLNPANSLANYSFDELILAPLPERDEKEFDIQRLVSKTKDLLNASEIRPIDLAETEIEQLIAFLETLTDSNEGKGKLGIPEKVPSKLIVE